MSEIPFLPFALPDLGEEEIAEVVDALRSGWITTGPKTRRFEQQFEEFLGGGVTAVAVNSATAGLHLALEAIGIGPGDEVIVPTLTFTATAEVVRYMGADPVFVDIEPKTLTLDPVAARAAVTPRTKAILPVHYAGLSCAMENLSALAREKGLRIVEDAAHALPTTWQGRLVGALETDATVFSFYATKPVATGEGGMLVTRDSRLAERARVMRLHGINRDAFHRYRSEKPAWAYSVIAPGFKYNMTDPAAALGIHQLKKAWDFQKKREAMSARYNAALGDLPLTLPPGPRPGDVHAWHLYVIQLRPEAGVERDVFIERMAKAGIGCSVHYIPLHRHPYWKERYRLREESFPQAEAFYRGTVSLPLYTKMTADDQDRVIRAVREVLGRG